jgi:hypothetical protein
LEAKSKVQTRLPDSCVLLGGQPRSGTTLLSSILRSSKDHFQAFELHIRKPSFVVGLKGRYTRRIFSEMGLPEAEYDNIVLNTDKSKMNLGSWVGPKEEVSAEPLSGFETNNFQSELNDRAILITKLMRKTADIAGKKKWGFKILGDIIYAKYYASIWPNAIFILMIRDPRDHALSVMQLNEQRVARNQPNFYDDFKSVANGWARTIKEGRKVLTENGIKFCEVKYEDLVTNTQNELAKLSKILDLNLQDAHNFYQTEFIARHTKRFKHHNNLLNPINSNSVGKWRKLMTSKEATVFKETAYDLMYELGYLE